RSRPSTSARSGCSAPCSTPPESGDGGRVRIVVTGLIATYPVGGVAWDYVQYVHGLAALGHDVTYLEDTGQWVYSPAAQTFTDDCRDNVAYLRHVLRRLDGTVPFAFRDPTGTV